MSLIEYKRNVEARFVTDLKRYEHGTENRMIILKKKFFKFFCWISKEYKNRPVHGWMDTFQELINRPKLTLCDVYGLRHLEHGME